MARTVALVSCVAAKRAHPAPAKDLYISPWFRKASRYADVVADDWHILSAEYGLVNKDDVIAPYEKTLKTMSSAARRVWGVRVSTVLRSKLTPGDTVVILAGELYREQIIDPIREWGCHVLVPLEGLLIGEQLSWLDRHTP